MNLPTVTVEFFGMARQRTGRRELTVSAATARFMSLLHRVIVGF